MYILQVHTGDEDNAKYYLKKKGFNITIPRTTRLERRRGRWVENKRMVFPSYIFLEKEELTEDDYYKIKSCSYVYKFLGCENKPYRLSDYEVDFIKALNELNQVLTLDKIELFGFVEINGFRMQVLYIDKRQKRAKFKVILADKQHIITLSYRLKQDELKYNESIHSSVILDSEIQNKQLD